MAQQGPPPPQSARPQPSVATSDGGGRGSTAPYTRGRQQHTGSFGGRGSYQSRGRGRGRGGGYPNQISQFPTLSEAVAADLASAPQSNPSNSRVAHGNLDRPPGPQRIQGQRSLGSDIPPSQPSGIEFVPPSVNNPPQRTRSTPPNLAEQQRQQMFLPHKSNVPAAVQQGAYAVPISYHIHSAQGPSIPNPALTAIHYTMRGGQPYAPIRGPSQGFGAPPSGLRAPPPATIVGPPPRHQYEGPRSRGSARLQIIDPKTGKPISLDDDQKVPESTSGKQAEPAVRDREDEQKRLEGSNASLQASGSSFNGKSLPKSTPLESLENSQGRVVADKGAPIPLSSRKFEIIDPTTGMPINVDSKEASKPNATAEIKRHHVRAESADLQQVISALSPVALSDDFSSSVEAENLRRCASLADSSPRAVDHIASKPSPFDEDVAKVQVFVTSPPPALGEFHQNDESRGNIPSPRAGQFSLAELLALEPIYIEKPISGLAGDILCVGTERKVAIPDWNGGARSQDDRSYRSSQFGTRQHNAQSGDRRSRPSISEGRRREPSFRDTAGSGNNRRRSSRHSFREKDGGRASRRSRRPTSRVESLHVEPLSMSSNRWKIIAVTDEFEKCQRRIRSILNKLTIEKFDSLSEQLVALVKDQVTKASQLSAVVELIFDKALSEPTFAAMYADLCLSIALKIDAVENDVDENLDSGKEQTFKRILLNQCQQEFESGVKEIEITPELTSDDIEKKKHAQKRRFLGNVKFIGELFKKGMIREHIMHTCIVHLLTNKESPQESPHDEDLEALCKLLTTIGANLDHEDAKNHIDAYFGRFEYLTTRDDVSARVRFIMLDVIDLRKNKWVPRRKQVEAKTLEEIHKDAELEMQEKEKERGRGRMGSRFEPNRNSFRENENTARRNTTTTAAINSSNRRPSDVSSSKNVRGGMLGSSGVRASATKSLSGMERTRSTGERYIRPASHKVGQDNSSGDAAPSDVGVEVASQIGKIELAAEAFQREVVSVVREYFQVGKDDDVLESIDEWKEKYGLQSSAMNKQIVSSSVKIILDSKQTERSRFGEMFVKLLGMLSAKAIMNSEGIVAGLRPTMECFTDVLIDAPFLAEFIGNLIGALIFLRVLSFDAFYQLLPKDQIELNAFEKLTFRILQSLHQKMGAAAVAKLIEEQKFEIGYFLASPFDVAAMKKNTVDFACEGIFIHLENQAILLKGLEEGCDPKALSTPDTGPCAAAVLQSFLLYTLLRDVSEIEALVKKYAPFVKAANERAGESGLQDQLLKLASRVPISADKTSKLIKSFRSNAIVSVEKLRAWSKSSPIDESAKTFVSQIAGCL